MERVIAYVDGFNFYFGLKASRWERYLWLRGVARYYDRNSDKELR